MEWNNSGIGLAIQKAKSLKALFVVVIHGEEDDEGSKSFLSLLDLPSVTSVLNPEACVALKLKYGSEGGKQFSALYPVVLVPSIYFINSTDGVDVEVTGGAQMTEEKLLASINKAIDLTKKAHPAQQALSPDDVASPRASRVDQARLTIQQASSSKPKETYSNADEKCDDDEQAETPTPKHSNEQGSVSNTGDHAGGATLSLEERVARAKQLLAVRKEQKDNEEEDKGKNSEKERRELGKNLQEFKRTQEDLDAQKAAEERRKDKEEEKVARARVKAQIEQDRLEKQARYDMQKQQELDARRERERKELEVNVAQAERMAAARSTMARVQFRLPDGGARTNAFSADAPLSEVYAFVTNEIGASLPFRGGFSLTTTFPKRQLDQESMEAPLRELGLAPSGTVLVLPKSSGNTLMNTNGGGIMEYVWLLLTPLTLLWGILTSYVSTPAPSTPASTSSGASPTGRSEDNQQHQRRTKQANAAAYRSEGNITRLRNLSDDDDDENNTWNGNSTQQQ